MINMGIRSTTVGQPPIPAPEPVTITTLSDRWRLARTFKDSMVAWARSGFPFATMEVKERRLLVCEKCDQAQQISIGSIMSWPGCKACGCPIARKVVIETETCPLDKWPKKHDAVKKIV